MSFNGTITVRIDPTGAAALLTFLGYLANAWPHVKAETDTLTTLLGLHGQDGDPIEVTLTQNQADQVRQAFDSLLPRVLKGENEDGFRSEVCQTNNGIYKAINAEFTKDHCICLG